MAIYKPSNLYPNLKEIDLDEENIFSCQVNTSGETVQGYKLQVLSPTNVEVYAPNAVSVPTPVKNKGVLSMSVPTSASASLKNNTNGYYKWTARLYNAPFSSTKQPNTKVCEGFLTGSTKSVLWTSSGNEQIVADKWVEINTTGSSSMLPILEPNTENLKLPAEGENFVERFKISWVTDKLGFNKTYSKLEFDDEFTYNYKNGTTFSVYNCSKEHTPNSFFTDPNDSVNLSNFVVIYSSAADKTAVEAQEVIAAANFPYTTGVTIVEQPRKITGYSSDTGEIRVQQKFNAVPKNGQYYVLYEYDSETNTYKLRKSGTSQCIGGTVIATFVIFTNEWNSTIKQLFIQPNINIKSDDTNPNEIVFDDGTRVDIIKRISTTLVPGKTTDITFERLDDSQWLLEGLTAVSDATPPIIPKSSYTIFTDFIDSVPESVFYARKTSTLGINYRNLNDSTGSYQGLTDGILLNIRDIEFSGIWTSVNEVQIKYYKYYLIDKNDIIVAYSDDIYSNDLNWSFRGLECDNENNIAGEYTIQLVVVDEYNKTFIKDITFSVQYTTVQGVVDVELNCNANSIQLTVVPPKTIAPIVDGSLGKVNNYNINRINQALEIPSNEVLKYGEMIDTPYSDIIFPATFTVLTQFQITSDLLNTIPVGSESPIFDVAHVNKAGTIDVYTLKVCGFEKFYIVQGEENSVVKINDSQFCMKLYKNDNTTPLSCFDNGTSSKCNISEYLTGLYTSQHVYYSIQTDNNYEFIDTFPDRIDSTKIYVLTQRITYNGITYPQGVYRYINKIWSLDISADYVFIDNLSQIQSETPYTFSDLNAPVNTQGENGNLLVATDGNVWLDTYNNCKELNEITMDKKWLIFYLTVDNTKDVEAILCTVKGNNEGV